MKKNMRIGIMLVLCFFAVVGGLYAVGVYVLPDLLDMRVVDDAGNKNVTGSPLLGKQSPQFNLPDLNGKYIKLSNFSGQPIIIIFWNTWSKESTDQIKILDDYIQHSTKESTFLKVIAISSQEDESVIRSFFERGKYDLVTLVDKTGDVSTTYNVKSAPTLYFVDTKGFIREIYTGMLSEVNIHKKVDNLFQ
jgi:peroxiredoxin